MKSVKVVGYSLLLISFIVLIIVMNGEGQTAVSAQGSEFPDVTTSLIASGFQRPSDIANSGDGRLFIVEQSGIIHIIDVDGTVRSTPFLDITERVNDAGNQGLLGLAFDPFYEETGYFYVNYTHCSVPNTCPFTHIDTPNLSTRISRFQISSNPYIADPDSEQIVMEIDQPTPHHNGGDINFGLDGFLYIGMGDGKDPDDPDRNAQNMGLLLGKILRIDVNSGVGTEPDCDPDGQYTIPNAGGHFGNPFVDGPGGNCDEIWSLGLRNPWRFSFDRATGSMFISDVGQNNREEVNYQPANGGGENWGWRCYEGSQPHFEADCAALNNLSFPIVEYPHFLGDERIGCAVTGGFIYRGQAYPALNGYYFYADYCVPNAWMTRSDGQGGWEGQYIGSLPGLENISTFGEDCHGELYAADHYDGEIYQIQLAEAQISFGGEAISYLPIIYRPLTTATATGSLPTPSITPSPTSIAPEQCF